MSGFIGIVPQIGGIAVLWDTCKSDVTLLKRVHISPRN